MTFNGKSTWMDTFYLKLPLISISTMEMKKYQINKGMRTKNFDMSFQFHFERTTENEFTFYVERSHCGITVGNYKFQFQCDINVFEETKTIELPFKQLKADAVYVLKPSDSQISSSDKLQKEFEFMILVKLIEYDQVQSELLSQRAEHFRNEDLEIYNNATFRINLCHLLDIWDLDVIFTGRMKMASIDKKVSFIKRTADISLITGALTTFWTFRKESLAARFEDMARLPFILNYILRSKMKKIPDRDLTEMYIDAHHLGLEFLIHLSRDCILHRVLNHEKINQPDYETFLYDVVDAAVSVNDDHLLLGATNDESVTNKVKERVQNSGNDSWFILYSLKRISKKREPRTDIRTVEPSTSRYLEL